MKKKKNKIITILSVTSDIGKSLAKRYSSRGDIIIGTYRSEERLKDLEKRKNCYLFPCDISDKKSVRQFSHNFQRKGLEWDTFISCPANPLPLCSFFNGNFGEWDDSVRVNSIDQLRVLHYLYPFRNKKSIANVVYFAGGGINKSIINFSAYTASKVFLVKMCEILNAENKDINAFIIGPGWVKTKIHNLILNNLNPSEERYSKVKEFLKEKKGTKMKDIFDCIEWLCAQGKEISGGRNFSVAYDEWGDKKFSNLLKFNPDLYKLRRKEEIKK